MTIETGDINKNSILLSTTLILVLITTILFGPFIPHLLRKGKEESSKDLYQGLLEEDNNRESQKKIKFEHPNNEYLSSLLIKKREEGDDEPIGLGSILYNIDRQILKPLLVDDWKNTVEEHVKFTKIIKEELNKQD